MLTKGDDQFVDVAVIPQDATRGSAMTTPAYLLAASSVLYWAMVLFAGFVRFRGWTRDGMVIGFGNRDDLPEASPIAARSDRAARNMLENLVVFATLLLAAWIANVPEGRLVIPAHLFFWGRLAYFPTYVAGIAYLRTAFWAVGTVGMIMIAWAVLRA
jgi:uncharacterized MAPEG superfamily protein